MSSGAVPDIDIPEDEDDVMEEPIDADGLGYQGEQEIQEGEDVQEAQDEPASDHCSNSGDSARGSNAIPVANSTADYRSVSNHVVSSHNAHDAPISCKGMNDFSGEIMGDGKKPLPFAFPSGTPGAWIKHRKDMWCSSDEVADKIQKHMEANQCSKEESERAVQAEIDELAPVPVRVQVMNIPLEEFSPDATHLKHFDTPKSTSAHAHAVASATLLSLLCAGSARGWVNGRHTEITRFMAGEETDVEDDDDGGASQDGDGRSVAFRKRAKEKKNKALQKLKKNMEGQASYEFFPYWDEDTCDDMEDDQLNKLRETVAPMFVWGLEYLLDEEGVNKVGVRIYKFIFDKEHSDTYFWAKAMKEHAQIVNHGRINTISEDQRKQSLQRASLAQRGLTDQSRLFDTAKVQSRHVTNVGCIEDIFLALSGRSAAHGEGRPIFYNMDKTIPCQSDRYPFEVHPIWGGSHVYSPEYALNMKRPSNAQMTAGMINPKGIPIKVHPVQCDHKNYFKGDHFVPPLLQVGGEVVDIYYYKKVIRDFMDASLPEPVQSNVHPGDHLISLFYKNERLTNKAILRAAHAKPPRDTLELARPVVQSQFWSMVYKRDEDNTDLSNAIAEMRRQLCSEDSIDVEAVPGGFKRYKEGIGQSNPNNPNARSGNTHEPYQVCKEISEQMCNVADWCQSAYKKENRALIQREVEFLQFNRKELKDDYHKSVSQIELSIEVRASIGQEEYNKLEQLQKDRASMHDQYARAMRDLTILGLKRFQQAFHSKTIEATIPHGWRDVWLGTLEEFKWLGEHGRAKVDPSDINADVGTANVAFGWKNSLSGCDQSSWGQYRAFLTHLLTDVLQITGPDVRLLLELYNHCFEAFQECSFFYLMCGRQGVGKSERVNRFREAMILGWIHATGPKSAKAGMNGGMDWLCGRVAYYDEITAELSSNSTEQVEYFKRITMDNSFQNTRTVEEPTSATTKRFVTELIWSVHYETHAVSTNCGPCAMRSHEERDENTIPFVDRMFAHIVFSRETDKDANSMSSEQFKMHLNSGNNPIMRNKLRIISGLTAMGLIYIKHLKFLQPDLAYAMRLFAAWDQQISTDYNLPMPSPRKQTKRRMTLLHLIMEAAICDKFFVEETAFEYEDMRPNEDGTLRPFSIEQLVDPILNLQTCCDFEIIAAAWSFGLDVAQGTTAHMLHTKTMLAIAHGCTLDVKKLSDTIVPTYFEEHNGQAAAPASGEAAAASSSSNSNESDHGVSLNSDKPVSPMSTSDTNADASGASGASGASDNRPRPAASRAKNFLKRGVARRLSGQPSAAAAQNGEQLDESSLNDEFAQANGASNADANKKRKGTENAEDTEAPKDVDGNPMGGLGNVTQSTLGYNLSRKDVLNCNVNLTNRLRMRNIATERLASNAMQDSRRSSETPREFLSRRINGIVDPADGSSLNALEVASCLIPDMQTLLDVGYAPETIRDLITQGYADGSKFGLKELGILDVSSPWRYHCYNKDPNSVALPSQYDFNYAYLVKTGDAMSSTKGRFMPFVYEMLQHFGSSKEEYQEEYAASLKASELAEAKRKRDFDKAERRKKEDEALRERAKQEATTSGKHEAFIYKQLHEEVKKKRDEEDDAELEIQYEMDSHTSAGASSNNTQHQEKRQKTDVDRAELIRPLDVRNPYDEFGFTYGQIRDILFLMFLQSTDSFVRLADRKFFSDLPLDLKKSKSNGNQEVKTYSHLVQFDHNHEKELNKDSSVKHILDGQRVGSCTFRSYPSEGFASERMATCHSYTLKKDEAQKYARTQGLLTSSEMKLNALIHLNNFPAAVVPMSYKLGVPIRFVSTGDKEGSQTLQVHKPYLIDHKNMTVMITQYLAVQPGTYPNVTARHRVIAGSMRTDPQYQHLSLAEITLKAAEMVKADPSLQPVTVNDYTNAFSYEMYGRFFTCKVIEGLCMDAEDYVDFVLQNEKDAFEHDTTEAVMNKIPEFCLRFPRYSTCTEFIRKTGLAPLHVRPPTAESRKLNIEDVGNALKTKSTEAKTRLEIQRIHTAKHLCSQLGTQVNPADPAVDEFYQSLQGTKAIFGVQGNLFKRSTWETYTRKIATERFCLIPDDMGAQMRLMDRGIYLLPRIVNYRARNSEDWDEYKHISQREYALPCIATSSLEEDDLHAQLVAEKHRYAKAPSKEELEASLSAEGRIHRCEDRNTHACNFRSMKAAQNMFTKQSKEIKERNQKRKKLEQDFVAAQTFAKQTAREREQSNVADVEIAEAQDEDRPME